MERAEQRLRECRHGSMWYWPEDHYIGGALDLCGEYSETEVRFLVSLLRFGDVVVEAAAAAGPGELSFHRVPGTGLGTLDVEEADAARARGFEVETVLVRTDAIDDILDYAYSTVDEMLQTVVNLKST